MKFGVRRTLQVNRGLENLSGALSGLGANTTLQDALLVNQRSLPISNLSGVTEKGGQQQHLKKISVVEEGL